MSDVESVQLFDPREEQVRQYLSQELEPQTGRAEERFRLFVSQSQAACSISPASDGVISYGRHRQWKPRLLDRRLFSFAGAALAACLALVVGMNLGRRGPQPVASRQPAVQQAPTSVDLPWVQQQTYDTQTFDGGTYLDESGQPVRILRRRQWERTRWFDDNRELRAEKLEPRDDLLYLPVKTY